MTKMPCAAFVTLFAALAGAAGVRADSQIPGQVPLMVVGDQFRYVHGSWARYRLKNAAEKLDCVMSIAILGQETKKGVVGSWIEVGIDAPDTPRVVTSFLAEETPQGPGRLMEAIVDVEGFGPFSIPKKFFEDEDSAVGKVAPVKPVKRMERGPWTLAGKTVSALDIDAEDDQGRPVKVLFSEEAPPLGILTVRSEDVTMDIQDWGMGATSQISGKPMSFYMWLIKQVGRAMSEGAKAGGAK